MDKMQRNSDGTHGTDHGAGGPGPYLMGAHTLTGDAVLNRQGEVLGDIKEIMLNVKSGQVVYAVLAFGGFMSMGEKLFAVPWHALVLDPANKGFVLNVSKARFANAPGFDKDAWPDMANPVWASTVHTFYGTDVSVE